MKYIFIIALTLFSCKNSSPNLEKIKDNNLETKVEELEKRNKKLRQELLMLNQSNASKISDLIKYNLKGKVMNISTEYYYVRKNGLNFIKGAKIFGEVEDIKDETLHFNTGGQIIKIEHPYGISATYQGTDKVSLVFDYTYEKRCLKNIKISSKEKPRDRKPTFMYTCDGQGNVIYEEACYGSNQEKNCFKTYKKYNAKGFLKKEIDTFETDYFYDVYNNLIQLERKNDDSKIVYNCNYKYNSDNFVISKSCYIRSTNTNEVIRYTYGLNDEFGNWLNQIMEFNNGNIFIAERKIEYFQ